MYNTSDVIETQWNKPFNNASTVQQWFCYMWRGWGHGWN